jgi:hypothetical protein
MPKDSCSEDSEEVLLKTERKKESKQKGREKIKHLKSHSLYLIEIISQSLNVI